MVFGLFDAPTPYKGQKYSELKKTALESGHPFIDSEFPPDDKSLFYTAGKMAGIEWKRPQEICDNPQLFVEGASANDVTQGSLGNCWFVAACSALAGSKEIWAKVIPSHKDQEWSKDDPKKHPGIFHFQFWRFGEWMDVVIDDFLPTRDGNVVFVHSKSRNEFWSALLEKAYAKLFGCYEALDGGELAEALEDFTGGVAEPFDLVEGKYAEDTEKRDELFSVMKKSVDNRALAAAAIPAKSSEEMETAIDVGLVKGHAYGITAVKRVAIEGSGLFGLFNKDKLNMVRLRNPWGGSEWNGPFSDGSPEWEKIDKASREKIGLTFDEDGEFWMLMDDFVKYFTNMSICRVVNTSFFSLHKTWHETVLHSEWSGPSRTGGCVNNKETFLNNPQFLFDVTADDEDEVMISLTQKRGRGSQEEEKLTIGFTIVKVEDNREYRCHDIQTVIKSSVFKNGRSILLRHVLKKGRYVVVATTFEPGHSAGHLLRLYAGNDTGCKELVLDKPKTSILSTLCCCCTRCRYPKAITRIKVIRAMGLQNMDTIGGADPYVYMTCEGRTVRTQVVKDSLNPEFGRTFILYRSEPLKKPIKIEVWNSNTLRDSFMGRHILAARDEMDNKVQELPLASKAKRNHPVQKVPGSVFIEISHHANLLSM